jgi:hypothetical protein
MDPYLENPNLWPDVHARLITVIGELLTPGLRPRYVARVETRTFAFGSDDPAAELYVVPDVHVVERLIPTTVRTPTGGAGTATMSAAEPIDITDVMAMEIASRFLEIRDAVSRQVVTVIEVLSPSNKVPRSASREAFVRKRNDVAQSDANWLEIDLLRGGEATWSAATFPRSAYRAMAERVNPHGKRRKLGWPISLRNRLPVLPVPLRPGEADVLLDVQAAVSLVYERADYSADIDYTDPPVPPLEPEDAAWADELLKSRGLRP